MYIYIYIYIYKYQPRVSHAELPVSPRPTRTPALPMYILTRSQKKKQNTDTQIANPSIYSQPCNQYMPLVAKLKRCFATSFERCRPPRRG